MRNGSRGNRPVFTDERSFTWLREYGRCYWVARLPADRPEDELLNAAAIALELDLSVESVRKRIAKPKASKLASKKPRMEGRRWPSVAHELPTPSGKRRVPLIRRGDLPRGDPAVAPNWTAERFVWEGAWHVTKNYAIQKRQLRRYESVRFRAIYSPVTGYRVEICKEVDLNRVLARRSGGPPELNGSPSAWLSDFLEELAEARGEGPRARDRTVIRWGQGGCLFLDGEKLAMAQLDRGQRRWYLDRAQKERILEGVRAFRAEEVPEDRQWLSQTESVWACQISRNLLRVADSLNLVETKRCGKFKLYRRDQLRDVQATIQRAPAQLGDLSLERAAARAGISRSRLKSGIDRGALSAPLVTIAPGTLRKKVAVLEPSAVAAFAVRRRKSAWPPSQTTPGFAGADEIQRLPEFRAALNELGSLPEFRAFVLWPGWVLRQARDCGVAFRALPGSGTRVRYQYRVSALLEFLNRARKLAASPAGDRPNHDRDAEWHRRWKGGASCGEIRDDYRASHPHELSTGKTGWAAVREAIRRFERRQKNP
jgi:hypothetical protein